MDNQTDNYKCWGSRGIILRHESAESADEDARVISNVVDNLRVSGSLRADKRHWQLYRIVALGYILLALPLILAATSTRLQPLFIPVSCFFTSHHE